MTETNEIALAAATPRRWESLLTTLDTFAVALDHDPQMQVSAAINTLADRVAGLETRLTVLEQHEESSPAPAVTVIEERE